MKTLGFLLALLALGMGTAQADPHHHRGHVGFGLYIGAPAPWYYGPPAYYPPYYYQPRVVVVPPEAPTVYVEQAPQVVAPAAPAQPPAYWYYCQSAKAYYPYVKNCPEGWQAVQPQPSAQ